MDRATGIASPQADGSASLSLPATERLAFTGRGAGMVTWPSQGGTSTATVSLGSTYTLRTRIALDLGLYGTWQRSNDPTVPTFREVGVVLGLSLDVPPLTY